jgi:hypothetical protein
MAGRVITQDGVVAGPITLINRNQNITEQRHCEAAFHLYVPLCKHGRTTRYARNKHRAENARWRKGYSMCNSSTRRITLRVAALVELPY